MDATLLVKDTIAKHKGTGNSCVRKKIKALIVEKFLLMQAPLRKALEAFPYMQSIMTVNCPSEAKEILQDVRLDIVILSMSVSLKETLQITKMVRTLCPQAAIILITGNVTPEVSRLLVKSGIQGILDASSTEQDLKNAVEACVTGNIFHTRAVYDRLTIPSSKMSALTTREMQVLALILEGEDNHSISKGLYITIKTVEAHATRIYSKLNVSSRAQAILRTQELCLF